ncbi:unnamed protein product [Moneuplotes crassus]|uniref:COMM domain-containing protein n=1 Tax=Euplotes crassus TaxID=5936 RepID=A0AAD1XX55_EUPCR|nr:unnamed protein product [Moneuplotes crassus]
MEQIDSLESAGSLLNHLPNQDNFEQFLERIISGMIENQSTKEIFSEREMKKLGQLFSVSHSDLYDIIEISIYFFEKLAFTKEPLDQAMEMLKKAKLKTTICTSFESVWTKYGETYRNALKKLRVCVPDGLDFINWKLNIPLDSSHIITDSKALFKKGESTPEIRFRKDTKAPFVEMSFSTSSSQIESVHNKNENSDAKVHKVLFNKENLQKFFEELEKNCYVSES